MQVTIRRQGGFAGTTEIVAEKNFDLVPPTKAAELRATLDQIKRLAEHHRPVGADFLRYELSIDDSGSRLALSVADDGSDSSRHLVELINRIAAA
jgi:emfourin